jgi:hypothetical protein
MNAELRRAVLTYGNDLDSLADGFRNVSLTRPSAAPNRQRRWQTASVSVATKQKKN